MVGVKPVPDALGRVNKLEVIPLEELGRPRVDVVVNCSGVFRDLFVNQMNLLDRAVKIAAELDEPDEMNFVRKHAKQQVTCTHMYAWYQHLVFEIGPWKATAMRSFFVLGIVLPHSTQGIETSLLCF